MPPRSFMTWAERAAADAGQGASFNPYAYLDTDLEEQREIEDLIAAENEVLSADAEGFDEEKITRAVNESLQAPSAGHDEKVDNGEGSSRGKQANKSHKGEEESVSMSWSGYKTFAERTQIGGESSSSDTLQSVDSDYDEDPEIEYLLAAGAELMSEDGDRFVDEDDTYFAQQSLQDFEIDHDDAPEDANEVTLAEEEQQYGGKGKGKSVAQEEPAEPAEPGWEVAGMKRKEEMKRLGIQRAEKREALKRAKEERARKAREDAEEEARLKETRAQQLHENFMRRLAENAELKRREKEEKWERKMKDYGKGLEEMIKWCKAVTDRNIPDDELPIVLVEDTERANHYTPGIKAEKPTAEVPYSTQFTTEEPKADVHKEQVLTELGLTMIPLIDVRKRMIKGLPFLEAWAASTVVRHLRVVEYGRCQLRVTKENGEILWQAAFTEFGESTWVRLADMPRATITTILEAANIMPHGGPRFSPPENSKPKIIVVAHAMNNDAAPIEDIGIIWSEHFEVVDTIDTQQLTRPFCNLDQPGLTKLMGMLGIRSIGRHHGSNDSTYTAYVLIAIVLQHIKDKGILPIAGNPVQDVGRLVDQYRGEVYKVSSSGFVHGHGRDACNVCGSPKHDQIECKRRCLYCWERQLFKVCHSYLQCPMRRRDEKFRLSRAHVTPAGPKLLRLRNPNKEFAMTEKQARLLGVRLAPTSHAANRPPRRPQLPAASSIQNGILLRQDDPRRAEQMARHKNKGDYEKDEDEFPGLPRPPLKK